MRKREEKGETWVIIKKLITYKVQELTLVTFSANLQKGGRHFSNNNEQQSFLSGFCCKGNYKHPLTAARESVGSCFGQLHPPHSQGFNQKK